MFFCIFLFPNTGIILFVDILLVIEIFPLNFLCSSMSFVPHHIVKKVNYKVMKKSFMQSRESIVHY